MYVVDGQALEAMVEQVVRELPESFPERVESLRFAVEDRASREDERRTAGAQAKGETVADLGNRNQPIDMVAYMQADSVAPAFRLRRGASG